MLRILAVVGVLASIAQAQDYVTVPKFRVEEVTFAGGFMPFGSEYPSKTDPQNGDEEYCTVTWDPVLNYDEYLMGPEILWPADAPRPYNYPRFDLWSEEAHTYDQTFIYRWIYYGDPDPNPGWVRVGMEILPGEFYTYYHVFQIDVPEPASLLLLALGGVAVMRRREQQDQSH